MSDLEELEEKITQLDQETSADHAQLDVVLNCIEKPLQWLTQPLVESATWKRHVWHVLKNLVPKWIFALSSSAHRSLVKSTLVCSEYADHISFAMAKVSLPILIECLITQNDQASLDTLEMYSDNLKYLSLQQLKLYAENIQKPDVDYFCDLICSIPAHLANVFGIQLNQVVYNSQHGWYIDRNFYAKVGKCLAENMSSKSVLFTQGMVSKVIRQGYEDILIQSIYPFARVSPDGWSSVLEPCFDRVIKPTLQYIKSDLKPERINRISKELSRILFNHTIQQTLIDDFLTIALLKLSRFSWADDTLARLAITTAIHASQGQRFVLPTCIKVIETWSDLTFIQHASSRERTYITSVVLSLMAYLSTDEIQYTIMSKTALLRSVSDYFNSGDKYTAQLGAVIAETVSAKMDPNKPIDTSLLEGKEDLMKMKKLIDIRDIENNDDSEKEYTVSEVESDDDDTENDEELDPDAIYCPNEEEEEMESSDDEFKPYLMEEESDDEGLKKEESSKSKGSNKVPVFIRDLIRYLKDSNDPQKLEIGLNAAALIVRRKTGAGTELSESSVELARYLVAFPETYEIENFRALQQDALIALIVGVPETVTGFIIDELYDRNTSAGQKQLILSAISIAVRELSGWDAVSENKNNFQSSNQETRMESTSLTVGKNVFTSKRMQVAKQQKENVRKSRLAVLAGPVFFFPLLVGWWEGAQGRIKYWIGSNTVLAERFIMTLNIIMHSSTNLPDKRRIVQEYFEFVSSMRHAESIGVKKALLLGVDCIVNTCYKGQESLLFHDYNRELSEVKVWLEEIMENNPEPKLQEISVGILIKLSQIAMTGYLVTR